MKNAHGKARNHIFELSMFTTVTPFPTRRFLQRLPIRGLATHTPSKGAVFKTLATGPGLDDFIRGEEAVEDETVELGNTSQYVHHCS